MHKITFKMTLQDRLEEFNAGIVYASPLSRIIRYGTVLLLLGGFLLTSYTLFLMCYHQYHPANWPLVPWPPRPFSSVIGWLVGISLGSTIFWRTVLDSSRSVRLFPEHVVWKRRVASGVVGWQDVTALSQAGPYLHLWFCQDTPNVIVVPKSAFSSLKGAEAFYAVMLDYWQEAAGKEPPMMDLSGVWPPAPHVGNSAEPGDTPQH